MQTPKNVKEMKALINPKAVADPGLPARLSEMCGFQIRWHRLDVAQAGMVWWAWQALNGDGHALRALEAARGHAPPDTAHPGSVLMPLQEYQELKDRAGDYGLLANALQALAAERNALAARIFELTSPKGEK